MPVTPPGPGEIVPIPDPVTGGVGAAVTVAHTFNAMWKNAQTMSTAGDTRVGAAIALADPAPRVVVPILDTSYVPPVKPTLPDEDPANAESLYNASRDQILAMLQQGAADFISEYFPHPEYYEDAINWCARAVRDGGTGVNVAVEQQLFERERARVGGEVARAESEAMSSWADRGFPLPPGALTSQVNQIRLDGMKQLATASRDIMVKTWETEVENVRFAVTSLLAQRQIALDAMGNYLRTLILGPETAMKLATGLAGLRTDLARALTQMYSAEAAALEPRVRLSIADADLKMRGEEANIRAATGAVDAKVRATMAGAQMFGTQAAAGLNAINTSASISGSDSSSL
ncbi:hypothetical protein GmRootV118_17870 [Variovorax sp. V118]|uniref:hypothetical protein n=1 Tax=Variovorax sp. V118 TaxID=3065954 RepID=UPI0034E8E8C9